ncbi:MAG: hypothetical protein WD993_09210 [Thermoleophilaceae bacterium]
MHARTSVPPQLNALGSPPAFRAPKRLARLALAIAALTLLPAAFADRAEAQARGAATVGGGAVAGEPPKKPAAREARGSKARLTRKGLAIPPADAPPKVKKVIRAGNRIARKPYKWGGGHGRLRDSGYDCSGSISFALRKARLMRSSLNSTGFMSWGRRGPGKWITIRANSGHAYMVVAGLRFDTSARSRTGSRWTREMRSPRGYRATHPPRL